MSTNDSRDSRRILVVDDEPSIVDAVATALRYEGFVVREEGTGRGSNSMTAEIAPRPVPSSRTTKPS